ncbi:hypothetical protein PYW07_012935 [Mythimna separata]|uniref:Uncharacterized protein n=1 Tax=Mythimna separata TaxID=271217 RepID=A0AAD7Y949_MYTSE|nr:hypothetical protein PYW07_012935 [Mythimna separata]
MEKLPMCRLCLAENVRMYVVVNKDLHELYERLTDNPFVTKDRRPMLACFICCTKLKQCCQLQRKCVEAEELLTQMTNEDYELNSHINQNHFECRNYLIWSPMVHVSIESDDECQTECDAIKEELPDVCERLDDVIEPEEEHQSDDLKLENLYNSYSDANDVLAQQSEYDSEDDVPLIEIKTEVEEEQEVSRKKRRASDTTRSAAVKKTKLHTRGNQLEDVITENQRKNEELVTKVTQKSQNCPFKVIPKFQKAITDTTPRVNLILTRGVVIDTALDTKCNNIINHNSIVHIYGHTGKRPFQCDICQSCFSRKEVLRRHIRTHTGEKPYKCEECQLCFSQKGHLRKHIRTHTGEKPFKCEECQRCFSHKFNLTNHIRTHTGEKPYKCEECQLCFREKGHLRSHFRTHTGEKPFKCEECQLCFRKKGHLTNHIRTHTGEKPFKCDLCQKCYSLKDSLRKHIRTHSGKKPF